MQNIIRFSQPNNYVANPVHIWQLGFIADGKNCIVRIVTSYRFKLN